MKENKRSGLHMLNFAFLSIKRQMSLRGGMSIVELSPTINFLSCIVLPLLVDLLYSLHTEKTKET